MLFESSGKILPVRVTSEEDLLGIPEEERSDALERGIAFDSSKISALL